MIPVGAFFDLQQFMRDIVEITDSARGPAITKTLVVASRYSVISITDGLLRGLRFATFPRCLRIASIVSPAAARIGLSGPIRTTAVGRS